MPCQTTPRNGGYCIHQEEKGIGFINSALPPGRFLLSGASGMLGTALGEAMAAQNHTVLQLLRCPPIAPNQFQWNPDSDGGSDRSSNRDSDRGSNSGSTPAIPNREPLEGLRAAFHFSGANLAAHRWTTAYKREIIRSRVESTRILATALARLRRPPKMLLVASAVGIYGDRGDELLDETSPPGTGFLADVCKQWEAAARPAAEAGIRVVHLRFGTVLAPGAGALARLLPWFRLGLGGKLGSGSQYMSWIALPDVLAALFFLLDSPAAVGPYNVTSPNPVTNTEFTRILASQLHRPAFFPVPAFALRLGLGEIAREALLSSTRAYPAKLVAGGFQFSCTNLVHALPAVLAGKRSSMPQPMP